MNMNQNIYLVRKCSDCIVELRDFAVTLIGDPFAADRIVSRALLQNKSRKGEEKDIVDLDLLMSDVIGLCLDCSGCPASADAEYVDGEWEDADDDDAPDDDEAVDDDGEPDERRPDLHDDCCPEPIVANDRETYGDAA